jgi:REP element-mobilizing transposase RayT
MEHYRQLSHFFPDLKHHLVWIPQYRKPALFRPNATRLDELFRWISESKDVEILKGYKYRDHWVF